MPTQPALKTRPLGRSGIQVPTLCFGGNIFGWTVDQPTSFQLLDTLASQGFTFIDTADVYSKWVPGHTGGESETILGHWMKSRNNRKQIILATKVGRYGREQLARPHQRVLAHPVTDVPSLEYRACFGGKPAGRRG